LFGASALIASDVEPARRRKFSRGLSIRTVADNLEVVSLSDAIVIAVKPQTIDAVLDEIAQFASTGPASETTKNRGKGRHKLERKLFISIAAGVPIARIEAHLGNKARVIRVMPNAPAMIGRGMAALVRGKHASATDESFALKLFQAVGDALALKDEGLLDAVTALSGSGPAYVYLFVKALSDAAVNEGLSPQMATRMTLQTLAGAVENMRRAKMTAADLIRMVASPGGTTEAALRKFAEEGFSDVVAKAVTAAAARSRELGRAS